MVEKINLTNSLSELEAIVTWFDDQKEVDVELGLTKVKEAAKLIKDSKVRLAEIENEFSVIEKEISSDSDTTDGNESEIPQDSEKPIDLSEIPF